LYRHANRRKKCCFEQECSAVTPRKDGSENQVTVGLEVKSCFARCDTHSGSGHVETWHSDNPTLW
jgi:hypothetical protein